MQKMTILAKNVLTVDCQCWRINSTFYANKDLTQAFPGLDNGMMIFWFMREEALFLD